LVQAGLADPENAAIATLRTINTRTIGRELTVNTLFSAIYVMYTVTLKELKAALKVNAQAGQSGAVNKTSFESTVQDDDFQQVKRRWRHISNDTSETGKKSAVKQPPKTVPTRNFFAPLRTNGMDTETTGAENTLQEKEASRKSGGPPPLVMTSTANLIGIQSDLKVNVTGEHEFRNTQNGNIFTIADQNLPASG
jgi:hypothetical protein